MKRSRAGKGKAAGKGPQAVEPLAGDEAQRLKALIESADGVHTLGGEDLLRALKADRPCDSKSCKGKTGNPNCLCNLVPAPDSYRKAGLWARQADVLGTLGADPADAQRKDRGKPVGLKNLGNTCYVNSVLQCLFANQAFRRAVYALRQPLADEPIVKELRELFLAMEHGCRDPVDPAPLARALNLDHAVQQDGQEFMKLFLTLLEARFSQQEELRDIIQALFRGQSGYLTLCQECFKQSESSSRSDNFYEVDVPVKGHRSLQESLNSLLNPEYMEGDNAYFCEHCQTKVTATRQLELRQLPPVLCFSLQRFVFDFQRMDRVKVSDKFAFPLTLDMAPIINQAQRKDLVYDLEAIMVHKGGSAMQGHYVAHIKMEPAAGGAATGAAAEAAPDAAPAKGKGGAAAEAGGGKRRGGKKAAAAVDDGTTAAGGAGAAGAVGAAGSSWWRFDDDAVTELKGGPTASGDHGGGAKPAASAAASAATGAGNKKKGGGGRGGGRGGKGGRGGRGGRGKKRGGGSGNDSDPDYMDATTASAAEEQEDADLAAAMAASLADAAPGAAAAVAAAAAPAAGAAAAAEAGAAGAQGAGPAAEEIVSSNAYLLVYRRRGEALPLVPLDTEQDAALAAARESLESEQQQAMASYAEAKQRLVERQATRQSEVRTVMEAAARLEDGDLGRFVPLAWLDGWANGGVEAAPDPVDNSQLLCPHNKLDPAQVPTARRISTQAWQALQESCRGGPELSPGDACPICLAAQLDAISAHEDTQAQMDSYAAMADALAKGDGPAQGLSEDFYISATWLQGWVKRKDKKNMSDKSPTAEITCACGRLAPESGGKGKKRVAVPADFYRFLQRGWTAHCAAQRAKQARSKSAATGGGSGAAAGGGGSGVWEASGEGEGVEVICLDSPTAAGAGQAAAAAAAEVKEEGGEAEAKRPRRRGRAAAAPQAGSEQQQQAKQEAKEEPDVVMLDADSSDEPLDVTEATARGASADAAAGGAGAALPAADTMLDFPVDTPACPTCTTHLQEAKRVLNGMKDRMDSERRDLAPLVAQQQPPDLDAGATYRLVPRAFMDQWRAYMQQAGKRTLGSTTKADQIVRPPSLAEAMLGVLCECHRPASASASGDSEVEEEGGCSQYMLAYPPPAVLNRRGRWVLASSEASAATEGDGPYELVSSENWELLHMYYGPGAEEGGGGRKRGRQQQLDEQLAGLLERGIAATLVVDAPPVGPANGSPGAAGGEQPSAAAAANGVAAAAQPPQRGGGRPQRGRAAALVAEASAAAADSGSDGDFLLEPELTIGSEKNPYKLNRRPNVRAGSLGSGHLETDPPVCSTAVAEREAALRAARLTYTGEQVMVEVVQSAEEAVASGEPGGGAERKSKRARKGRAPVTVDSTHTLQTFRNLIFQELGVHPRNAQLFLRGAPLMQDETATLAECEVFPGDEVKVVDSGEHDSTDYSSLFPMDSKGGRRRREAERGFTGTALTGLVPAAAGAEGEDGDTKQEGGSEGQGGGIDVDAELAAAAAAGEAMEG